MRILTTALIALVCVGMPVVAEEPVSETWTANDATTTLEFRYGLMEALGVEVREAGSSTRVADHAPMTFAAPKPWGLLFSARNGAFIDLVGGQLRHQGGLELRWPGGSASLNNFELRPSGAERTLAVLDSTGQPIFLADHMHFKMNPDTLQLDMFNMDLRLAPEFAERLGEARHADLPVGVMAIQAQIEVPLGSGILGSQDCGTPNWDDRVDVGLIRMSSVSQIAREAGVRVAVTPSATLKNVGEGDVPWHSKFSGNFPPYNNDQHPYLIWNMYRISDETVDGVAYDFVETIGAGPLKHAFLTVNSNCECSSGHILYAATGSGIPTSGCEDTYGTGTNASRNSLSGREEINPFTGIWERCGSIFDPDCDDNQNTPPVNGSFDRRMAVGEDDLQVAGADYFMESWYVVREDVNIFNTMGYRQIDPQLGGSTWSFGFLDGGLTEGPVINRWVDPANPGANERNVLLDTGEGLIRVAVKTTLLGNGYYRYEYAVANFDFDRQLNRFSVPVPDGAFVHDIAFRGAGHEPGPAWEITHANDTLTWEYPAISQQQPPLEDDALNWGTLFRFGMTVNLEPAEVDATMGILEGAGGTLNATTLVPQDPIELFADGFESGGLSTWAGTGNT